MKESLLVMLMISSLAAFGIDERLEQAMRYGPQPLKDLLATHLELYRNSFPHRSIYYMPYLDYTMTLRDQLVRRLSEMPQYEKHLSERGPMHNFVVRVSEDYELDAREFDRRNLDRLSVAMRRRLRESSPDQFLPKLERSIVRHFQSKGTIWSYWGWDDWGFQEKVVAYVMASGLTNQGTDLARLTSELELEEGDIDHLAEEARWRPALERVAGSLGPKGKAFLEDAEEVLAKGYLHLKGTGTANKTGVRRGDELHLLEVHPDLAILRGFVGNDCSTDVSFGYPYSPFERTFYVSDKNGLFLGYVALSIIEYKGKRAIFLHTIAGPEIKQGAADMILRAILKARTVIGGELVFLPEDHRIGENINFMAIDEMMRRYVRKVSPESIVWLDRDYRRVIMSSGSDSFYDDPDRNHSGRRLDVPVDNIEISIEELPFISPLAKRISGKDPGNCRGAMGVLASRPNME